MKKCINWERIIAVGGLTFCTTLVATGFETTQALINAGLIAGIALFTELKFESEPITKVQRVLHTSLII
jgi:hypothetical protein